VDNSERDGPTCLVTTRAGSNAYVRYPYLGRVGRRAMGEAVETCGEILGICRECCEGRLESTFQGYPG